MLLCINARACVSGVTDAGGSVSHDGIYGYSEQMLSEMLWRSCPDQGAHPPRPWCLYIQPP